MIISTVVAVALGLTPVGESAVAQIIDGDYSAAIGRYTQTVDRHGTTHVRGADARGVPYELIVDRNGYVEATVGDGVVNFRVQEVS